MEDSKRIKRLVEEQKDSELLPGIPTDVTFCVLIPKLSWRDLRTLFSVSPIWQQEIQSRQVYDIRRRLQSTEDLAVIGQCYPGSKREFRKVFGRSEFQHSNAGHFEDIQVLSIYSARDKCCYDLPTIPIPGAISTGSQFIALDGAIYILGGRTPMEASSEVYVLDVAEQQREWKPCANMLEPRLHFRVGVLNGKIYVFGGRSPAGELVLACEMYNPKSDTWSSIEPMSEGRTFHKVAVIGEELFVYSGYSGINPGVPVIYCPSKNEWRQMELPDFTLVYEDIFVARGKFYAIHGTIMNVYNSDTGSWTSEQSCESIPSLGSSSSFGHRTIALGDELLVIKYYDGVIKSGDWVGVRARLYQSRGFGKDTQIVWEKTNCFPINTFGELGFLSLPSPLLCSIQL